MSRRKAHGSKTEWPVPPGPPVQHLSCPLCHAVRVKLEAIKAAEQALLAADPKCSCHGYGSSICNQAGWGARGGRERLRLAVAAIDGAREDLRLALAELARADEDH